MSPSSKNSVSEADYDFNAMKEGILCYMCNKSMTINITICKFLL